MRTIGRLAIAYLLAGIAVAALENWMAHVRAGSSILEVVVGNLPTSDKVAAFYDLVLFPILVWPSRVMSIVRGG